MNLEPSEFANRVVESCESTSDLARVLGEKGFPHGTWVSARNQTAGRGRLGRHWLSLEGNLFLSILAHLEERGLWTWIPLTTAVAIAELIRRRYRAEVKIKWPNDLWLSDAKLGGILCEAYGGKGLQSFVVIGIGLNCLDSPDISEQPTRDLASEIGHKAVSADRLRPEILENILIALEALGTDGPQSVIEKYRLWSAIPEGTLIEWLPTGKSAPQTGKVISLGPSGELIVETSAGRERLLAEDVKIRTVRKEAGGFPA